MIKKSKKNKDEDVELEIRNRSLSKEDEKMETEIFVLNWHMVQKNNFRSIIIKIKK